MNTRQERLITIECRTNGLYEWGSGWVADKADKWDNFWEHCDSIFWKYLKGGNGCCGSLVTTEGSIYLHPMQFSATLRVIGVSYDKNGEIFGAYEDLKSLMAKCAEEVGFTFTMRRSQPLVAEFEMTEE